MPTETGTRLRAILNSRGYSCLVSQPRNFVGEPQRLWPTILFLHGAGERGTSLANVARHGLPRLLDNGVELTPAERDIGQDIGERFVVVAPQCAHYEVWNEAALLALLDQTESDLHVDPARVYLTGMSLGGFGVWSLGLRHPDRFAALVPICGGGRVADVTVAATRHRQALHTLGIWAFHGAGDRVVPLEESERMIEALRRVGMPDVTLTVYPDAEHDAWTPTYANPDLYEWMLKHRR